MIAACPFGNLLTAEDIFSTDKDELMSRARREQRYLAEEDLPLVCVEAVWEAYRFALRHSSRDTALRHATEVLGIVKRAARIEFDVGMSLVRELCQMFDSGAAS